MPTPKQLPSGNWRCQVYDYTDADNKKHYKSFTAPTKKEAQYLASEYSMNREEMRSGNLSLLSAAESYISSKENVLSPATLIGYRKIMRNDMADISALKLSEFNRQNVQAWVNQLSVRLSSKSVKNAYGLFSAVMSMFTDKSFKVQFPQAKKQTVYIPSDKEVKQLITNSSGDLQLAFYLAAFCGLRRGEICALTRMDVHNGYITVNKSMGMNEDRSWSIKLPKTASSEREVDVPDFLCKMLKKKTGQIISLTPDRITDMFGKLLDKLDMERFRFHDLRHYYVSINHAIGVPDAYIMEQGGWSTDRTMKAVYRNTLRDEKKKFAEMSTAHFESMQKDISHEISHEIKKAR